MARTITLETDLELQTCCACGIVFAVPAHYLDTIRQTHKNYSCPNGHGLWFPGESTEEKLKRQLKEAEQRIERQRQDLAWYGDQVQELDHKVKAERRAHGVTKAKITRERKRIAHGVCPCCNRSFPNDKLQHHLATKHPEYAAAPVES
jgi:hypothetical protein